MRFAASQTALEGARLRFATANPDADREAVLLDFVSNIHFIISDEILKWRGHLLNGRRPGPRPEGGEEETRGGREVRDANGNVPIVEVVKLER